MKRLILIFSILALVLCGCGKKDPIDSQVPQGGYDNGGDRTVLYVEEHYIPLAYTVDGKSQIEPGVYWYYELEPYLEKTKANLFQNYHFKNLEPTTERTFEKLKNKKSYAVNGDWPLFCSMEHQSYTSKNQAKVPETVKTPFLKALESNGLDQNSVAIYHTWTCDFDRDGVNETFLSGNCGAEEMAVLGYVRGESCQLLSHSKEVNPLVMDLNGTGNWSLVLKEEGDYNQFSVYDYKEGNFALNYQIIY